MNAKSVVSNFPIVCVGGSAGGLDAYTRLLRHLPVDMGVAIVIVNHLRTVATRLHDILPRYTAMPVELITERLDIQPNHVFIIPAQRDLHVLAGEFRLKPISKPRGWPLAVGDRVLIKPGEKIPADGVIVKGESSVNEAMLTGESTPVSKKTGDKVIGGAINGEGSLTIEVKGTGKESFLSQVIDLVKQAQESKSKTQNLADTAAMWLTLIALSSGALTFVIWLVTMSKEFSFAIERAVTVMVITCPHALGLAVPLVVAVTTALAASNGLLIRNRGAFESARKLQAIIFDKTGTLTEGRFGVTDTLVLSQGIDEETLRQYAASVDASSEHPIAKAIADASEKNCPSKTLKAAQAKAPKAGSRAETLWWCAPATCANRILTTPTRASSHCKPKTRRWYLSSWTGS